MSSPAPPAPPPSRDRRLPRPVLWLILATLLLCAVAVAWRVSSLVSARGSHAIGDGQHVESYGFDLGTCTVPVSRLAAAGFPRDGVPALTDPEFVPAAQVAAINEAERGKFLVPSDRVIGLELGGEARAYPLRLLNWHEVVNDRVGGVPVAVTYNPLCDSAVVFDRRVGDEEVEFGVSGLLLNSNLLMYDRRADGGESLWSQLLGRAVCGPAAAAGSSLRVLPFVLTRWDRWLEAHPESAVLKRVEERKKRYSRDPYASYFGSDKLRFPVEPLPPESELPLKARVVAVEAGGLRVVYPLPRIEARASGGRWEVEQGSARLEFAYDAEPGTVEILSSEAEGGAPVSVPAFWFAWYAHHPDDEVLPR